MRLRPLLIGGLGFGLLGSGGLLTALLAALNSIKFKKILISSLIFQIKHVTNFFTKYFDFTFHIGLIVKRRLKTFQKKEGDDFF